MTGRGLILAAPASGSGKTLVAAGLARYLLRRGLSVATAKAGPDFIDPTFHAAATGRPCLNLDVWGMRPATLAALVGKLEASADIVLCEGVMGLFDGTGSDGEAGSTAELARVTGWPIMLIVDARGQGASVAALLHGFATHQPSVPLSGVIFNRISSERHGALLAGAAARHLPGIACLGTLPADPGLALPSRHLGLVPAAENSDADAVIERCAARIGASVDVQRLLSLALGSVLTPAARAVPMPPLGQRIAVACDEAFCFAYHAVLEGWRSQGAELSFFSPLADEPPGAAADAVYLPGGYPELWADRLASTEAFMTGLRRAPARGAVIYGECGGYMVLGDALIDREGCKPADVGAAATGDELCRTAAASWLSAGDLAHRHSARHCRRRLSRPRISLRNHYPASGRDPALLCIRRSRRTSRRLWFAARIRLRFVHPPHRSRDVVMKSIRRLDPPEWRS